MVRDEKKNDVETGDVDATDQTAYLDGGSGSHAEAAAFVEPHERVESAATSQRYLIGETLGEGGMAVVHRATDVQLNRLVAVKRLRPELAHQQEARQRFFAEAEILAGLDHPGTTSVFDAGRLSDGDCFYAMKKVRGRTLTELLTERTENDLVDRASQAHMLGIFLRVCQTVASAHNQGVIHRDLKPENIMVDDFGAVYVMDWGLAKQLTEDDGGNQTDSDRTRVGAVMGTPAYMSPEQASGHAATSDRQADVFSLGVMLYEILTGVNPFRGETAVESMKGVMYHNPDTPLIRDKRINRSLSAITMKAIDKDPFRRYRSAVELAEDIQRHREFRAVSAVEPTAREKLGNWSRRHPRLAAAAATLSVVFLLGALVTTYQASIETAMVVRAHDLMDEIEESIEQIQIEITTQEALLQRFGEGPERLQAKARHAELEAQLEVAEDDRRSYALAITGFTILSPDERAIAILRESVFEEIHTLIAREDFVRARARIRGALRNFDGGNLVEFSPAEYELLVSELETIERKMEESEQFPAASSVESQQANSGTEPSK